MLKRDQYPKIVRYGVEDSLISLAKTLIGALTLIMLFEICTLL